MGRCRRRIPGAAGATHGAPSRVGGAVQATPSAAYGDCGWVQWSVGAWHGHALRASDRAVTR